MGECNYFDLCEYTPIQKRWVFIRCNEGEGYK